MPEGLAESDIITLQVGERRFTTSVKTLTGESAFFKARLSSDWSPVQVDGCYFIDADSDLFVHILRFLRSGVYPLFYDKTTGHDFAKYHMLLGQAQYFCIDKLIKWLRDQKYLKAVMIHHAYSLHDLTQPQSWATSSNYDISYQPIWLSNVTYVCPLGILEHRGEPFLCEEACREAQDDRPYMYATDFEFRMVVTEKRYELKHIDDSILDELESEGDTPPEDLQVAPTSDEQ